VLLCAEDDDLDLVALVHLARLRGLDFEVRPGVEIDDAPLLGALDDTPHALLVLVRSEHLTADRARELENTFALARTEEQDLLAIRFERRRVGECLEEIAKRLEQLGCGGEVDVPAPDASTGRIARVGLPIAMEIDFDVDFDDEAAERAPEFEVTVHATMSDRDNAARAAGDAVRMPTVAAARVASAVAPRRMPLWFGLGAALGAAVLGVIWIGLSVGSEAAPPPPAPVVDVASEVQVIEAVEPEPVVQEAWPPAEAKQEIAPTPLNDAVVMTPDAMEITFEPAPAKRRKPKSKRSR
jgi:hypothetical protein